MILLIILAYLIVFNVSCNAVCLYNVLLIWFVCFSLDFYIVIVYSMLIIFMLVFWLLTQCLFQSLLCIMYCGL